MKRKIASSRKKSIIESLRYLRKDIQEQIKDSNYWLKDQKKQLKGVEKALKWAQKGYYHNPFRDL